MKTKVYYIKEISKENILKIYKALNIELPGKVAIKIHSGELGNQNFLKPELYQDIQKHLNGTLVETNTAYEGSRNTTEKHQKTLEIHGWNKYYDIDILDSETPDIELEITNGIRIKKNYIGNHFKKYDSLLIISHFKGHPMGGFGGALKQLSIGCASSYGKAYIHSAGTMKNIFSTKQEYFLESMSDAASSICKLYENKICFINVLANLSIDCDCCSIAENPCMEDIGILASTDPLVLDQACMDLIYNSKNIGKEKFIKRVEDRKGNYILECANKLKIGSRKYELIEI